MKLSTLTKGLAVLAAVSLGACGGQTQTSVASVAATQSMDTAQVLAQARQMSETSVPYSVDGGALTLSDTTDTSDAVPVSGP